MPNTCIFGNGATVTTDTGFAASADVEQASGLSSSVTVADVTPVSQAASSYKLKKASQRMDTEPISVSYYYDPTIGDADALPALGAELILTITYPSTPGKQLSGKGFIVSHTTGQLVSDEVAMGSFEFQFKGGVTTGEPPAITSTA